MKEVVQSQWTPSRRAGGRGSGDRCTLNPVIDVLGVFVGTNGGEGGGWNPQHTNLYVLTGSVKGGRLKSQTPPLSSDRYDPPTTVDTTLSLTLTTTLSSYFISGRGWVPRSTRQSNIVI